MSSKCSDQILDRRAIMVAAGSIVLASCVSMQTMDNKMFGLIGKATATDGKRDELIAILIKGTANMPGCLSYIVAKDVADPAVIWITEVWDSRESHEASLQLPSVQAAIARGRPLIAGMVGIATTEPVSARHLRRR